MPDINKVTKCIQLVKGYYFNQKEGLITEGWVDSFELLSIIDLIEKNFEIKIPVKELRPEDFDSIDGICKVVERYQKTIDSGAI